MSRSPDDAQLPGGGLSYEASLPIGWQPLEQSLPDAELVRLNIDNEAVLNTIAALQEYRPEAHETAQGSGQEYARLDFKLNLVLDLVGQLVAQHIALPDTAQVKFNAQAVRWSAPLDRPAPEEGNHLLLSLYLHPGYPRPVQAPARVVSVHATASHRAISAHLEGLSEPVQTLLEKLIFRHHRRSIASTRHIE